MVLPFAALFDDPEAAITVELRLGPRDCGIDVHLHLVKRCSILNDGYAKLILSKCIGSADKRNLFEGAEMQR